MFLCQIVNGVVEDEDEDEDSLEDKEEGEEVVEVVGEVVGEENVEDLILGYCIGCSLRSQSSYAANLRGISNGVGYAYRSVKANAP
jgi:hypothetical protein